MLENHPQFSFLIERTGWLLIHSLWQFALWALIALVLLKCLRRASSATRYSALVCILLLMTLTPVVTWWFLPEAPPIVVQSAPEVIEPVPAPVEPRVEPIPLAESDRFPNLTTRFEASASAGAMEPVERVGDTDHEPTSSNEPDRATSWSTVIHQTLEPWLTWIVGLWFTGMLLFSLRPLIGWATMRWLSQKGISDVPENILGLLRETTERLGLRKAVSIFQSSLVTVPLVTGFLRPMILLPASVVTGFPPAQLQAILAHELAHIRRYDQFVNLWQTLVETVFFYHPLVWWLSHQIRCERENCDDLAVNVTGGKVEYGRALLALDELRGRSSALAISSHGGSLSRRIRRLVTGESSSHRLGLLGIVAFLLLLSGIAAVFLFWNPEVPSLVSLNAERKAQAETAMSAEEQAA